MQSNFLVSSEDQSCPQNIVISFWKYILDYAQNNDSFSPVTQVQLERIRQADSLERIRAILNDTKLTDINQLPETWHPEEQGSKAAFLGGVFFKQKTLIFIAKHLIII